MRARWWTTGVACASLTLAALAPLQGQQPAQSAATPAGDQSVPADLTPLLTATQSDMRLVVQRYNADRATLNANYIPFSHATAFHEMIPGHNLVAYIGSRFAGYRARIGGNTPFFGEGWPLYWELLMYELGFHDTPEEKVGALFWRMHRCARIIFSLKFHMGEWSPKDCIDFLVDRVGHERDNATAEVRRSFQGGYGPLYQAAYLLGGLQLRGLRKELVDSGQLTNTRFHDEILRQGNMPIALIRLALTRQTLTRDMPMNWKFYGDIWPKQ